MKEGCPVALSLLPAVGLSSQSLAARGGRKRVSLNGRKGSGDRVCSPAAWLTQLLWKTVSAETLQYLPSGSQSAEGRVRGRKELPVSELHGHHLGSEGLWVTSQPRAE